VKGSGNCDTFLPFLPKEARCIALAIEGVGGYFKPAEISFTGCAKFRLKQVSNVFISTNAVLRILSMSPSSAPVAVVTGASSGIGLAAALSLHEHGYHVVAAMRTPSSAPKELLGFTDRMSVVAVDVTNETSVEALASWLVSTADGGPGRCDVVVNNAGYGVAGTVETLTVDAGKKVFDVNVWGVMRVCKALLPIIRSGGRGGLVLVVSSGVGVRGAACSDIYAASKFAYVEVAAKPDTKSTRTAASLAMYCASLTLIVFVKIHTSMRSAYAGLRA
jgi:NADP-dependent 3-hydroxy acid dehydrogenase YdfG